MLVPEMIVTGIQVDNAKNRAYAQRMGTADVPWPEPYANSVLDKCQDCEGDILVGPELGKQRKSMDAFGIPYQLLCLLCACLEMRSDASVAFLRLTDKGPGE